MGKKTYGEYKDIIQNFLMTNLIFLKKYDLSKVVTVPIYYITQDLQPNTTYSLIKYCLKSIRKSYYNVDVKGDESTCLVFSSSYCGRQDHYIKMKHLFDSIDDATFFSYKKKSGISILSLLRIFLIPIWLFQLKKVNIGLKNRIFIIASILDAVEESNTLYKLSKNKIKLLITFCDAHITDNVLTQKYIMHGVKTTTLQHGVVCNLDNKCTDFMSSITIDGFVSDNIIVWGAEARHELITAGIKSECIYVCGMLGLEHDANRIAVQYNNTKIFGIILSSAVYKDENEKLISIAKEIANLYCLKFVIRKHPSIPNSELSYIEKCPNFAGFSDNNINMKDFTSDLCFCITGKTTMYMQLLLEGLPTFQLISDIESSAYPSVEFGKFRNMKEFVDCYAELEKRYEYEEELNETIDYLVEFKNVDEKYNSVIKNIKFGEN